MKQIETATYSKTRLKDHCSTYIFMTILGWYMNSCQVTKDP